MVIGLAQGLAQHTTKAVYRLGTLTQAKKELRRGEDRQRTKYLTLVRTSLVADKKKLTLAGADCRIEWTM
ncbi:hypothetical protein [Terrimonas pollutisoli]|uniref:hypothetical protein n=1 Tax=Terrimonas pollutisoli TaxID=3034147 RepID=UPI0023EC7E6E|nr:hypothetical protein [Terrimonas sp. H1YJ31]